MPVDVRICQVDASLASQTLRRHMHEGPWDPSGGRLLQGTHLSKRAFGNSLTAFSINEAMNCVGSLADTSEPARMLTGHPTLGRLG